MYRFCPACGGELATRQLVAHESARQVCTRCARVQYRSAKPCAEVLVVRDGRVLLVRRAIEPGKGKWDIPGGFLEADEHPEAGALRELREETGLAIAITGLLGIYLDGYFYDAPGGGETTLNLCYLATATGEPQAGDDAAAVGWFAPDELPGAEAIEFRHQLQVFEDWRRMLGEERAD
jgi:8-oxo-dGTP diphosphatase